MASIESKTLVGHGDTNTANAANVELRLWWYAWALLLTQLPL